MDTQVGSKVDGKRAAAWLSSLASRLYTGEQVKALSKTSLIRPSADGLAVTTTRVMGFLTREISAGKIAVEVFADDIAYAELKRRLTGQNTLVVRTKRGTDINFGDLPREDAPMVLERVQHLKAGGFAGEPEAAGSITEDAAYQREAAWRTIRVVGNQPTTKAWQVVKDHASVGEVPWFVVGGESGAGVLAAFNDRCMIVKVGAMTSMMAGSFGGGRITTFHYTEITGIEYNAGMMMGVLEVLTPSYQGSGNKDYWRGTRQGRNTDSNDPWTLSNALPMGKAIYQQALPLLNEMRSKIVEAKHPPAVHTNYSVAASSKEDGSLADELKKLGGLREQGVLDEEEFQAAKRAVIAKYTR